MANANNQEKSNKNVSCWLTESEYEALGRECEEVARRVPGARLSRSSFLAELYRAHRAKKSKES